VRRLGSKISGAATIIGDLVFVSDLDKRTTWALGARTGRTAWKTRRGGFNPAISDGRRIYFTGFTSLFALDPVGRPFGGRAASSRTSAAEKRRRAAAKRAGRKIRAARRARTTRLRKAARRARQIKFRTAPHGHRHSGPFSSWPSCHRHRHVYTVRGRTVVLIHNHCHTHVRPS
jgi:hypothetical protein